MYHTILLLLSLNAVLIAARFKKFKYPAADYYWPMTAPNRTTYMLDTEGDKARADLHGVRFTSVRKLRSAASLYGNTQWIDVDAGDVKDCLAFQFSSCDEVDALAVAFWIRIRKSKRILATGSYTNSTNGPGILIEYDDANEMLKVDFASTEKQWSVKLMVRKHSWCHITAAWTIRDGLTVILDGMVYNQLKDVVGVTKQIRGKRFTKMITIGRPANMQDTSGYGNFDISHLVIYFRSLNDQEMKISPEIPMEEDTEEDLKCCNAKRDDKCYDNPCSSRDCINIEAKYTDCICKHLRHNKCTKFPSTASPMATKSNGKVTNPQVTRGNKNQVTKKLFTKWTFKPKPENCDNLQAISITGCGNNLDDQDRPTCNSNYCYYGICRNVNQIDKCNCPQEEKCKKAGFHPVCGSDQGVYRLYENWCVLKRISCIRQRAITIVSDKSFCGDNGEKVIPLEELTSQSFHVNFYEWNSFF